MTNVYAIDTMLKDGEIIFVLYMRTNFVAGWKCYRTLKEAIEHVIEEKQWHSKHKVKLAYNAKILASKGHKEFIANVALDADIKIGTKGRTYSATLFPNGR